MNGEGPGPKSRLGQAVGAFLAVLMFWRTLARRKTTVPPPKPPESPIDPSERVVPSNRRAETLVAALLALAALFGFGFTAVYAAVSSNTQLLGIAIGGMFALLAAAAIIAGKLVVPQETAVEDRGKIFDEEETEEVVELIESGGEGISRRVLLTGAGGLAGAAALTAVATPLASLGPTLGPLHRTPWRRGVGLVDELGNPYLAADIQIGSFYTALPEGGDPESFGASVLVVRLPPEFLHLPPARTAWAVDGIVAYSKICPHAGCAISLYRYPTYAPTSLTPAFTCPCHYSTFAPGEGGKLIFGPAGRALPQLPLMVDATGRLLCAGAFDEDIGPSWWSVRRI
ncbi:MAG TPA: Rieske 2Fe-2S domain-containing protein [Solirubrobacteraceae bacterium]|jgi:ubiquinol-cytochrome c reductase iron-sulfur subunit|nr:Rieske 2Fe-2S domain-containing protein [Solirubrobacteraceae bacterium]